MRGGEAQGQGMSVSLLLKASFIIICTVFTEVFVGREQFALYFLGMKIFQHKYCLISVVWENSV